MIIWGSKGREIDIAAGHFNCPQCETQTPFQHKRVARYFTLYFIPLFQMEDLGEYVECRACGQAYKPEVLHHEPPSAAEKAFVVVRGELERGTPLEMVRNKLLQTGMDEETATELVGACRGDSPLMYCGQCRFTYLGPMERCHGCNGPLSPV